MNLLKTSFLSLIATSIKMLSMLVINKAVSVFVGPSGLALIGQFQNFIQISTVSAQGGINKGVTKYTAEYGNKSPKLDILFGTSARLSVVCSLIVGVATIAFSNSASTYLLDTEKYRYIFIIFGFTLPLFVINQLLLSIINGLKEVQKFIKANIVQSVCSLLIATVLIVFLGLDGALIAMVTNQAIVLIVVLWFLRNHAIIRLRRFIGNFEIEECKKLMGFSAMALTSAATIPVSHLIVRLHIGNSLGWDAAGYWQGIWYISVMYLMVVTTALSIYYLPRLSEITDKGLLRKELKAGYLTIVPIVLIMGLGIYVFRDLIISLLFTEEFSPMAPLFKWQLFGDVIKIISFLVAYLMVAKAMTKKYILTELLFAILFICISIIFLAIFGLIGVTYAFALSYFLYFLVVAYIVRKEIF